MNERDVRLLFETGHWVTASISQSPDKVGWIVSLTPTRKDTIQVLTLKRGNPRVFKTSDTALNWCREVGFTKISVHLHQAPAQSISKSQNTQSILLVEDNSDDIELTLRAIQRLDASFDMVVTRDGQEALDFLFAEGKYIDRDVTELPNLILLDLKLPKLNGLDVLKKIRERKTTQRIPVVILSTSDDIKDISNGYELGINSYIQKPLSYSTFCETIEVLGKYWLATNTPPPQ